MLKKNILKYNEIDIVIKTLWDLLQREYQYFAYDFLKKYTKEFSREIIDLFEYMLVNKSW